MGGRAQVSSGSGPDGDGGRSTRRTHREPTTGERVFRKAELIEILAAFPAVRTTIVGDLIADVYITARTERISREAPVLVLRHQGEELMPGGAGNVIKNMVRLGARPKVVGWVGDDAPGRALLRIFREWSLDVSDLVCEVAHATPTKTRILAGDVHVMPHQVLRLDRGGEQTLSADARAALCDAVRRELAAAGRSVVFSDYGAQTIDPTIVSAIRERPGGGARVLVDSRFALASFAGVDVVLPNEPEARALLGHPLLEAELPVVAAELYDRIGVETVLLTLGNKGLALFAAVECRFVSLPADRARSSIRLERAIR